ncbi:MAG: hypothetical protein FJW40_08555 [Acidobacteria bacterium]|nr:hypothetical protein [Acidobacteriota bacterium]
MTLGAEPKKIAALVVLMGVAAGVLYINVFSDEEPARPVTAPSAAPSNAAAPPVTPAPASGAAANPPAAGPNISRGTARGGRGGAEFRPSLRPKRPEDRADPTTVDPTLRIDLISRLETVLAGSGGRSLFEFSTAPPPPAVAAKPAKPEPKIIPGPVSPVKLEPADTAKVDPGPPPKAKAPPIPLKYYGYSSGRGSGRRAFFLDGEDILVAGEGEIMKKKYKVVRIGVNSVEMQDVDFEDDRQTLVLEEQAGF